MRDPRIQRLAKLLTNYCVKVQPGEQVLLRGSMLAKSLVRETYREILKAGGLPLVSWQDEAITEIELREGNDNQLAHVFDTQHQIFKTFDCLINVRGAENTRSLSGIALEKQRKKQAATAEIMQTYMGRAARGELRWVSTLFPTAAHAQEADMSLANYEDFVYGACFVDKDNPVAEWQKLSAMQQTLVDWLKGKKQVRVEGPNAELMLDITERIFINSDGQRNMPSGEIFTGPVEESVNGWVRFSYPAIYQGREVEGIELRFEEGKVVEASAKKNEPFLLSMLDSDEGARYLGEFAIGTNNGIDRFTKSILYDEKIGGTIHMAVGNSYAETGGKNKSMVHWDMICDMRDGGKIFVDDELFYDSGRFLIVD